MEKAASHKGEVDYFGARPRSCEFCEESIVEALWTTSKICKSAGRSPKESPQLYECLLKKRPILILELILSLALFSIILTFLLSSYKDLVLTKKSLREEREKIFSRHRVALRLTQVLSGMKNKKEEDGKYFWTFNNGYDKEAPFRGEVKGELGLDEQRRLCLVTIAKSGLRRTEVLSKEVQKFALKFFEKSSTAKLTLNEVEIPLFL